MRVADMTEAQVVNAILDQSDAIVAVNQFADEHIAKLRAEMESDNLFTDQQIDDMIATIRRIFDESISDLGREIKRISIEFYTFEEMRGMLEFREKYPELNAKTSIMARMFGELMLRIMGEMQHKLESQVKFPQHNKY